jgi:uncharacterized protein (TIGR00369 family)
MYTCDVTHAEIPSRRAGISRPDPAALLAHVGRMDGLKTVEAMRDGRLPMEAFGPALGVRGLAAESGHVRHVKHLKHVTLGATVDGWQVNAGALGHGGFPSALMDAACGLSVRSTPPAGRACPHVQASYRFLRPVPPGTAPVCAGHAVHRSRTLAVARCEIGDERGRLPATGESTHALVGMPEPQA